MKKGSLCWYNRGIARTSEMDEIRNKNVGVMCNLSQEVKEDGIVIGEIIINMHNDGLTAEQIEAVTDKDIQDVEAIIKGKETAFV